MEELKQQQLEALQVASEYCEKLIKGIDTIVDELTGVKLADTDEYLKNIISGINWIIEVFNGTKELLSPDTFAIDKEKINSLGVLLNDAINLKDDKKIASYLSELSVFVKMFKAAAEATCAKEI